MENLIYTPGVDVTIASLNAHSSMAVTPEQRREAQALLKNTSLYREFLAEREEILRHKWLESEKAGCDVGFDVALMDWITKYRSDWRRARHSAAETASDG